MYHIHYPLTDAPLLSLILSQLFNEPLNPSHTQNYGYNASHVARRHSQTLGSIQTSTSLTGARNSFAGGLGSPRTERFGQNSGLGSGSPGGPFSGTSRRRKEDTGGKVQQQFVITVSCNIIPDTSGPVYRPRQPSFGSTGGQGQPSITNNSLFPLRRSSGEGIGGDTWIRRKSSEKSLVALSSAPPDDVLDVMGRNGMTDVDEIQDELEGLDINSDLDLSRQADSALHGSPPEVQVMELSQVEQHRASHSDLEVSAHEEPVRPMALDGSSLAPPPGITSKNEDVEWRYKDPSGQIQGMPSHK